MVSKCDVARPFTLVLDDIEDMCPGMAEDVAAGRLSGSVLLRLELASHRSLEGWCLNS